MIDTVSELWANDWITVEGANELLGIDDIDGSEEKAVAIKVLTRRHSLERALLEYHGLQSE